MPCAVLQAERDPFEAVRVGEHPPHGRPRDLDVVRVDELKAESADRFLGGVTEDVMHRRRHVNDVRGRIGHDDDL